jgi:hypothetical protein
VNLESAIETIEDLIHGVNAAAGGGSPLLSEDNLTTAADIETSFRAQGLIAATEPDPQERMVRPWKKRGTLPWSEREELSGSLGFLPLEESGNKFRGKQLMIHKRSLF